MRLSFVGELGWELHIPRPSCVPVYQAVMAAGAKHGLVNAGYRAIDSLSIEKGECRVWTALVGGPGPRWRQTRGCPHICHLPASSHIPGIVFPQLCPPEDPGDSTGTSDTCTWQGEMALVQRCGGSGPSWAWMQCRPSLHSPLPGTRSPRLRGWDADGASGPGGTEPVVPLRPGYRHWHADLRPDDSPLEAGLAFTCKLKSTTPFLGRAALEEQRARGLRRRLVCFTVDE